MIDINIKVEDLGTDELAKLAKKASNLQPAMREAGLYMERETKLNFAKQSDPDGAPWAPLKASTLRRKRGGGMLRQTSTLMGGIALTSVSNQEATIQATAGGEYGIFHQSGTSRMAQRQFIGIGERHIPKIQKIFEQHFQP